MSRHKAFQKTNLAVVFVISIICGCSVSISVGAPTPTPLPTATPIPVFSPGDILYLCNDEVRPDIAMRKMFFDNLPPPCFL